MPAWKEWIGLELSEVSPKEKALSTLGGALSILLLIVCGTWGLDGTGGRCVIASMGASAVLLFAVPHGQLSQPWPVLAGHGFSALAGVLCARLIPDATLAAACAVGLSIAVMHQFKCIHPPGGATALTAVIGGPVIQDMGFSYVLFPILVNAGLMVALAVMFNAAFSWRRYPACLAQRPAPPPTAAEPTHAQIVAALRKMDSFVDVTEDDLIRLCQLLSPKLPAKPPAQKRARPREEVELSA